MFNNNQFVFVSTLVPPVSGVKLDDISFAAQYYQEKIAAIEGVVKTISITYSFNLSVRHREGNALYLVYSKNRPIRNILQTLRDTGRGIARSSKVLFYNLSYRNFLLVPYLKFFKRCKCYIIVADHVEITPRMSRVRRMVQHLINAAIRSADGTLVLSEKIRINKNTVCQEAILLRREEDEALIARTSVNKQTILFSGSIGYTTGIHIAIKAMDLLPDHTLYITGRLFDIDENDLKELLSQAKNHNIQYMGIVEKNDYIRLLAGCEYALSLRDVNCIDHQYNFPSKITEYLSYNKKVISSLYYNAVGDLVLFTPFDPAGLANVILATKDDVVNTRERVLDLFGKEKLIDNLEKLMS